MAPPGAESSSRVVFLAIAGLICLAITAIVLFSRARREQTAGETPPNPRIPRARFPESGLLEAVKSGSPGTVEGAMRRDPHTDRGAALLSAAQEGHAIVAEYLLTHGAAHQQEDVQAAFVEAVKYGYEDVVGVLLRFKADPNRRLSGGDTPLYAAAGSGYAEVVKTLLTAGASVNAISTDSRFGKGMTALHAASRCGHAAVVRLLIAKGADVNRKSSRGFTALDLCEKPSVPVIPNRRAMKNPPPRRHAQILTKVKSLANREETASLLILAGAASPQGL